jgi:WD40 repeat protein
VVPRRLCATASLAVLFGAALGGASLFDPALRFRTIRTEHFVIYAHQGAEALGRRLGVIAEEVWLTLQRPFAVEPPPRTYVVLVDQSELANGSATPVPYNTIVITTTWPAGFEFIGDVDDWLRLAFTHEFTHVVHLDRSESWARVIRGLFGRTPVAFPNLYLPTWQIEGLATFEESALTGHGRLHAGDFTAVIGEAARQHRLEPLDRVNGGLTDWPSGNAPYAYGLGFHEYLADRFGADTLGQLATATARRVPFTASRVFKRIYGESLGDLWREYERSLQAQADSVVSGFSRPPPVASDSRPLRITHDGFIVGGPRFDRFSTIGNNGNAHSLVYSVRSPHGFPALNRVTFDADGTTGTVSETQRLATRYLGSTTAIGRDELYFDQQELHRNVALHSDLFALSRSSGRVRRLTSGARLLDPDLSPDGRTLVAVREERGQRDLVLVRLKPDTTGAAPVRLKPDTTGIAPVRLKPDTTGAAPVRLKADAIEGGSDTLLSPVVSGFSRTSSLTIETLIADADTQFNGPRWSPDGKSIAVERHRLGGLSQIVVVDVETKASRTITPFADTRFVTPTWRPDGGAVVAAAAPRDQPFNLYEFSVAGPPSWRALTRTTGGALWPDISPDGKTLVFAGYTVDGFDVFTMPYAAEPASDASFQPDPTPQRPAGTTTPEAGSDERTYSPWPTLRPTSWTPIVEGDNTQVRVGAATGGNDVLGYHAYIASASWLVSGPSDAVRPGAATPDWTVGYAYDRWRPTIWALASNATSFFAGPPTASGTPSNATLRERRLEAGVQVPFKHIRVSHLATASALTGVDDYTLPFGTLERTRRAIRAAWETTSARSYGYSISPEDGVTIGATAERVPRALGSFGDATTVTIDGRAYVRGLAPHHVLAFRAAAGTSTGDVEVRRSFHLGGAFPNSSVIDLGRGAISLLRGFPADTFAGNHVALVNADYRLPLWRPQRGAGTWPIMLHTVHAAAFADAGHAWTDTFQGSAIKTSIGGELSADVVAAYFFRFTAAVGGAYGHDGSGTVRDRATIYARIGRAF